MALTEGRLLRVWRDRGYQDALKGRTDPPKGVKDKELRAWHEGHRNGRKAKSA